MEDLKKDSCLLLLATGVVLALTACAAPTATQPPAAAPTATKAVPTPTKAPTATPTKRPLIKATIVLSSPTLIDLPATLADRTGWLREEGLDAEIIFTGVGTKTLAAIAGGDADVGLVVSGDILSAIAQGLPIQVIGASTVGNDNFIIMRPEIAQQRGITQKSTVQERINALKGLRLGASSAGSGTDLSIRFVLNKYNINPDRDLEITYIGSQADRLAALRQGSVEAVGLNQPQAGRAIFEGFGIQLVSFGEDVPEGKNVAWQTLVARKDTQQDKQGLLEAFIRGVWRTQKFINERPDEAREATYPMFQEGTSSDLFRVIFDAQKANYPKTPAISDELYRGTLAFRNATSKGEPLNVSYQDFYTPRFVDAAKKTLGY